MVRSKQVGPARIRDKIIHTSIQFFNEQGTKAVSTNHIASAIGISPGNLYYHFRNMEDIIRAIFEQMDADGLEQYQNILNKYQPGTIEAMEQTFIMIQEYTWLDEGQLDTVFPNAGPAA